MVVIGDGAVGQCAVIAAKMRGASQIVLMSRHEDRQKWLWESGATAVVAERGEKALLKSVKSSEEEQMQPRMCRYRSGSRSSSWSPS